MRSRLSGAVMLLSLASCAAPPAPGPSRPDTERRSALTSGGALSASASSAARGEAAPVDLLTETTRPQDTQAQAPDPPRTEYGARWYASIRDDRARRRADRQRARALAWTRWLALDAIDHVAATHDGYAVTRAGRTTLCAYGPATEPAASSRQPSRCAIAPGVGSAQVYRLHDDEAHARDAYCFVFESAGVVRAGLWEPGSEGTRGPCPRALARRLGAQPLPDGSFGELGTPSELLEDRAFSTIAPIEGARAFAGGGLLCLHDDAWTCVDTGPLEGETPMSVSWPAAHPFGAGTWLLERHRSEGSSYWNETDDTLLAVRFDPGGVTVLASLVRGFTYEGREDPSVPMSLEQREHALTVRGACVELGRLRSRVRGGRRARPTPTAPELLVGDAWEEAGALDAPFFDRQGSWVLDAAGFRRVPSCPSRIEE